MNERRIILVSLITFFLVIMAWFAGLYIARYVWTENANYYLEMKHQYDYCPYCGEYIGK